MVYLIYLLPALVGFIVGFFLTLPANLVASFLAGIVSGYMLWQTKDAELGAVIGIVAVLIAAIFILSQWITFALSSGVAFSMDLSWLLRGPK